ncbi:Type I restriction modification DNA [sediment metagenome]|uniref:Type I restriction modification DNA n=1 Tax=sediment metagenome TaxID=749907 RepID=D9PJZ7_9ZZZZ
MELTKNKYKDSEVGMIPEDWNVLSIGDVTSISVGRDLKENNFSIFPDSNYKFPVFSNTVSNEGLYGYYDISEYNGDSLTVVGRGVGLGTAFVRQGGYGAIGRLLILFPKKNIDTKYLTEYINNRVKIFSESGGIPQLTGISIAKYLIPIPKHKSEQTAIANALSDTDALIESLEKIIVKKRNIKQGAMQELLKPKESWETTLIGRLAELYQPVTISQELFTNDGYLVYGANGIIGRYNKYNHEHWQTTITCRGSTCGTVNKTNDKCWITGNAMVVNVDNNPNIDKTFFYFLMSKQDFKNCITGSGQPQIVRKPLAEFEVSIPREKTEQIRIASIFLDMDTEINYLGQKLQKYKMIKQGMMQVLLTGKIRLL